LLLRLATLELANMAQAATADVVVVGDSSSDSDAEVGQHPAPVSRNQLRLRAVVGMLGNVLE
jgi:hypothetical protein